MHLTFQYNLLPTKRQHAALEGLLERQRLLYNAALHQRRVAWYLEQRRVEAVDQWRTLARATGEGAFARNAMAFWTLDRISKPSAASTPVKPACRASGRRPGGRRSASPAGKA